MADDESPQSKERIVPHLDDGYSDGMIGPMFGLQRLSVPAEKLRQGGERTHREGLVGSPGA